MSAIGSAPATQNQPSGDGGSTSDATGGSGIDAGNDVDRANGDGGVGSGPDEPGPTFPMTLRRTGGIADFDDRVVIQADGRVVVETRLVRGRTCTLSATQRQQLIGALTALRATPVEATDPSTDGAVPIPPAEDPADAESAPITLAVTDDLARTFDLTDPSLGGVSDLVGAVVIDVTLTSPANAKCSTPTTTTPTGVAAAG
ncbi:hypothetical protein [Humibacillus xanthopallidus]|uniref:hypothetical protein n=1 Tax=Humibacillus xanthopallidus TaxID=412689 RepID=UPI00384EBE5A